MTRAQSCPAEIEEEEAERSLPGKRAEAAYVAVSGDCAEDDVTRQAAVCQEGQTPGVGMAEEGAVNDGERTQSVDKADAAHVKSEQLVVDRRPAMVVHEEMI